MKTLPRTSDQGHFLPAFSFRPPRVSLEQIVAVKGLGKLKLRPIAITDEPAMVDFHRRISEESIYMRYFEYLGLDRRTSHERLQWICTNTADSYALVVEKSKASSATGTLLGVGRLSRTAEAFTATFDTLFSDEAQTPKLAKVLLLRLIKFAHAFGFNRLTSELLVADHETVNLCRELGFTVQTLADSGLVQVALPLGAPATE